jgi:hypothetical protein
MRTQRIGWLALATAAACATGGQRPRYGAVPESHLLTVRQPSDSVVVRLTDRARALGLPIVRSAPREGYIETGWYDVARGQPTAAPFSRLDSIVRYRVFADPVQGHTRILIECVRRIAWDPSTPERELERMVPPAHPGTALIDSLLDTVRADTLRAPGGPPLP